MAGLLNFIFGDQYESDGEEVEDKDAEIGLTHVGTAAYECLRSEHNQYHNTLWNVTPGKIVQIDHTVKQAYNENETVEDGHSDWLAESFGEIISRTEIWCDVTSLSAPDGRFMEAFKKALMTLHEKDKEITIRMLFGSILGAPVDCTTVLAEMTADIPKDETKLRLWVGAWRKGVSWNHSKIIAVDGKYLHTGGHNLYDSHYLQHNPISDISIEMEGRCGHDGHLYANEQWKFIEETQDSLVGGIVSGMSDATEMPTIQRVTVSDFPEGAHGTFPPQYHTRLTRKPGGGGHGGEHRSRGGGHHGERHRERDGEEHGEEHGEGHGRHGRGGGGGGGGKGKTPIITMGRYGILTPNNRRPADDAFGAMFNSAQRVIHMSLQDLGPMCILNSKIPMPGTTWPKPYLNALGEAIWKRGVVVEIILSNPRSVPANGDPAKEFYGNGWSCNDVACEIIKCIRDQFPDEVDEDKLHEVLENKLFISFLRGTQGQSWDDGMTMGLHTKHVIVDDTCFYIGSQNLYVCDLAEWGVVIDSEEETQKVMDKYWNPVWKTSYVPEDCDIQEVMNGLDIDRDGEDPDNVSEETKHAMEEAGQ